MRPSSIAFGAFLGAGLCITQLTAQAMAPPPYATIVMEDVKYGHHGNAHAATEAGWPRAFEHAKIKNYYFALNSTYGAKQAWFVQGYPSIAAVEAENEAEAKVPALQAELDRLSAADAAHVSNVRVVLAHYLPDASNGPDINPAEMRAWEVSIFRVKPGKEASFMQGAKAYQAVVQKAGVVAPWATYEVQAGMAGPTYLVFGPHKTLAEIDQNAGVGAAIGKAMTPEAMQQLATISEGFYSVETLVFTPSPEMSHLSPEWLAQDPKFWGKKAPAARAGQ